MRIKGLLDEDFINYKVPSMTIMTSLCDWKCCTEAGCDVSTCQNSGLWTAQDIEIDPLSIFHRYSGNSISKSIVFGGLEPMLQIADVLEIIKVFRTGGCPDDIVVYTGYYPEEIKKELGLLRMYENIVIKFGRFIPNSTSRFDDVLGVVLSSENQYGERLS